jgi:phosphate transport system substrate-binding protein
VKEVPLAAVIMSLLAASPAAALDQDLPTYKAVSGVSGQMKSVGSDTLGNAMQLWAKGFGELYPDVKITIEDRGSATAPPALLQGAAQLGPMSRTLTSDESEAFEKKYGYKASYVAVAVDALAVYVNKENPIRCLSVQQVDQIFSLNRKGSGGKSIHTWGEAGLTGDWASKPIVLYGRNDISGTYEFFRELVLYGGDFKPDVKEQAGSEAVVRNVASDKFAIGYSGIGYKTDGVRTVPLSITLGRECYDTSADATYSGNYPIARYLYIYFNKKPNEQIDPLRGEFIRYVLSKDGQAQTEKSGFYPLTSEMREKELKRLGLSGFAN